MLSFWSDSAGEYDQLDLEFAGLLAGQIAVAVEAQCHQQKLARERDRCQLLLEINNTLVSNLNLRELLSAISGCLRRVMPHDLAGLALHDPAINKLRITALDFPEHEDAFVEGEMIDLEENPGGRAFTTGQPVISGLDHLVNPLASQFNINAQAEELRQRAGIKSGCTVPLISHDRALGILGVARLSESPFTEDDAELLTAVGKQVAIAVENALAYREIDALKNKLQEEKLYLQEEIRTEYNFEEIVGTSAHSEARAQGCRDGCAHRLNGFDFW